MVLTKTFRRSGLLVLAGAALYLLGSLGVPGGFWHFAAVLLLSCALPVFAVSAFRPLLRGLLGRVGSRLLMSYALLVAPIFFLAVVLYAGVWLVAAQVASRRLDLEIERRQTTLERTARTLSDRFASAPDPGARRAIFEEVVGALGPIGDLGYSYLRAGSVEERFQTPGGVSLLPRSWIRPGPTFFLSDADGALFLAAIESRPAASLALTLGMGAPFRTGVAQDLGLTIEVRRARRVAAGPRTGAAKKTTLTLGEERYDLDRTDTERDDATPPGVPGAGSGPLYGRWILYPVSPDVTAVDWADGRTWTGNRLFFLLHSSVATEASRLFGEIRIGESATRSADVALAVMKFLGGAAIALFVLASVLAALLVLRISRTTRRLSQGVAEIEKGNFAHRVVLRGNDQLARLVRGFNDMASHLEASVAERAEKQALDRELQVARDLQRRLLPPADFSHPGVEIAIDFHPAAAIGGDFYDLVASDPPGVLTVVLADVSGHGLPTGIVMASAKASLSALVQSGAAGEELLSRLDAEIARTTDSRTFVTMAYLRFVLAERRALYTNAGHLYPYRVTPGGTVAALANPARPLGLGLPATFRTVEAPLEDGDLWVLFSDGIVEATRPGSDEEFGFARLERAFAGAAGGTAAAARDRVLAAWRDFTGGDEPADDRTLVVLRIGSTAGNA